MAKGKGSGPALSERIISSAIDAMEVCNKRIADGKERKRWALVDKFGSLVQFGYSRELLKYAAICEYSWTGVNHYVIPSVSVR